MFVPCPVAAFLIANRSIKCKTCAIPEHQVTNNTVVRVGGLHVPLLANSGFSDTSAPPIPQG